MSGICTPVSDGISMISEEGGIAVSFNRGDQYNFHMDKRHCDRLLVNVGNYVTINLSVKQFYDTFDVVWRDNDGR